MSISVQSSFLSAYRHLIQQLLWVELIGEYKRSFLGFIWLVVRSFYPVVLWMLMHRSGIFNPGDTKVPYPMFVFTGITLWNLFQHLYEQVSQCLTRYSALINESNFPHEALAYVKAFTALFYFVWPFSVVCALSLILGYSNFLNIIFAIFSLVPIILIGLSLGMAFAVFRIVLPDLQQGFDKLLALGMFLTPVLYNGRHPSGILSVLMRYNPLTYLLGLPRDLLIGVSYNSWKGYWISCLICLLLSSLSYLFFKRTEKKSIELLIV